MKSKNAEGFNFGVNRNQTTFFNSFDTNRSFTKFQCLNCKVWKPGHKFVPVGQFDRETNRVAVFRFCPSCWQSYNRVSDRMKKDFISRIKKKVRKASEVIIDEA